MQFSTPRLRGQAHRSQGQGHKIWPRRQVWPLGLHHWKRLANSGFLKGPGWILELFCSHLSLLARLQQPHRQQWGNPTRTQRFHAGCPLQFIRAWHWPTVYWTAPFRGWFGHKLTHIKHQHPSVKLTRLAMADKQIHVPFAIPKNCPK